MDRTDAIRIAHEIAGEHFGALPSPWDLIPKYPGKWDALMAALRPGSGNARCRLYHEVLAALPTAEARGALMQLEESWGADLAVQTEATFLLGVAFGRYLSAQKIS